MLRVNSKKVEPGDTFLALKNTYTDGHDYIEQAIDNGAACIIAQSGEYSVKTIIEEDTRSYLSNYLRELNIEKLSKIKLIGITGTNGKTYAGDIMCQLLNDLNMKTAYIGTNGFYLNGKIKKLSSSTPDLYELYELINEAIDSGCETVIIEISSKAIRQRHIEGLRFDMVVLTNFASHQRKDKEEYLNTKIELFKMIKKGGYAILNKKDNYYSYFALSQNKNVFYGTQDSDYPIRKLKSNSDFTEFTLGDNRIKIPLIDPYIMYNYAPAFIVAKILLFPSDAILSASLSLHQVDGRFETIKYKNNLIIIDYAYDSLNINNILKEIKNFNHNKIITIIGQGGQRRKDKRAQIGKLVAENSDYVIFTTDNPRNENEEDIINELTKEIETDNYTKILSRKEAIKKGINMLTENDILLILGKGHENVQIIGNDEFPFKDKDEVLKNIK